MSIAKCTATLTVTAAATAYTSGDQLGNIAQLTPTGKTFGVTGGTGYVTGITVIDESAVLGAFDLVCFNAQPVGAGDNNASAFTIAEVDTAEFTASFVAANLVNIGGRIVGTFLPVSGGQPVKAAVQDLWIALIARSANPVFAAGVNSLKVNVYIDHA